MRSATSQLKPTRLFVALLLGQTAACSDNPFSSDPFEGVVPAAMGERPVEGLEDGWASARGIWAIEGEKSAFPYNVTEIWCWRPSMTCNSASAELAEFDGAKFLTATHSVAEVDQWTENEIVFSTSGGCRTATTRLFKTDGSVVQTIETDLTLPTCKTDGRANEATGVPLLKKPRIVRMITTDEWRQRREEGRQ